MKEIFEQWAPLIIAAVAIAILVAVISGLEGFITQQFQTLVQDVMNNTNVVPSP